MESFPAVERLDEDAADRVETRVRRDGIDALGYKLRAISSVLFPSEEDVNEALVECELTAAIAGRPTPALGRHPGLLAWVEERRERWPTFGSSQLGYPHAAARNLRIGPSAPRSRAAAEGREAQWDAELDDLIRRLDPTPAEPLNWWERTSPIALTVVTGIAPPAVATRLGLDPDGGELALFHDVWAGRDYDGLHLAVQIGELRNRSVIVEPNGWLMTDHARVVRVSQGGSPTTKPDPDG